MTFHYNHKGQKFSVEGKDFRGNKFCVVQVEGIYINGPCVSSTHKRKDLAEKEIKMWFVGGANKTAVLTVGEAK